MTAATYPVRKLAALGQDELVLTVRFPNGYPKPPAHIEAYPVAEIDDHRVENPDALPALATGNWHGLRDALMEGEADANAVDAMLVLLVCDACNGACVTTLARMLANERRSRWSYCEECDLRYGHSEAADASV